jgi:hypothetical protein
MMSVQLLCLPVANTDYQLLSDEAVESIGREDYIRMVACMGHDRTEEFFRGKDWREMTYGEGPIRGTHIDVG